MKPMLAATLKGEIPFPVIASPKIDGIRALVVDGVLVSRSLKPIPNRFIQSFPWEQFEGLDGELVVGSLTDKNCMQNTASGVMSHDGEPDWSYLVFDNWTDGWYSSYQDRFNRVIRNLEHESVSVRCRIKILMHCSVNNADHLNTLEGEWLAEGYEGVMLRRSDALYKFGRSTLREFALVKVKRFVDDEAEIIGFNELLHNDNERQTDNLGHAKRSSEKDKMIPMGTLGSIRVLSKDDIEFDIGTGFTSAQRAEIWANRFQLLGRMVKYKHFAAGGVKIAPRFPVFLGFRHPDDAADLEIIE